MAAASLITPSLPLPPDTTIHARLPVATRLLRLDRGQLPVLWLVVGLTMGTGVLLRAALRQRPRRQITLLIKEFASRPTPPCSPRSAPPACPAVRASSATSPGSVECRSRSTTVSHGSTHRHLHCEPQTLADLVVDAQISAEQVCRQLVADRFGDASQTGDGAPHETVHPHETQCSSTRSPICTSCRPRRSTSKRAEPRNAGRNEPSASSTSARRADWPPWRFRAVYACGTR